MLPSRMNVSFRVCREVHTIIRTAGSQHSPKARADEAVLAMHVHPLAIEDLVLGSLRGAPTAVRDTCTVDWHEKVMNFSTKAPTCPTQSVVAAREFLLDVAELACQKNRVVAELFLSKFSKQAAHTAIFNAKTPGLLSLGSYSAAIEMAGPLCCVGGATPPYCNTPRIRGATPPVRDIFKGE